MYVDIVNTMWCVEKSVQFFLSAQKYAFFNEQEKKSRMRCVCGLEEEKHLRNNMVAAHKNIILNDVDEVVPHRVKSREWTIWFLIILTRHLVVLRTPDLSHHERVHFFYWIIKYVVIMCGLIHASWTIVNICICAEREREWRETAWIRLQNFIGHKLFIYLVHVCRGVGSRCV